MRPVLDSTRRWGRERNAVQEVWCAGRQRPASRSPARAPGRGTGSRRKGSSSFPGQGACLGPVSCPWAPELAAVGATCSLCPCLARPPPVGMDRRARDKHSVIGLAGTPWNVGGSPVPGLGGAGPRDGCPSWLWGEAAGSGLGISPHKQSCPWFRNTDSHLASRVEGKN